MMFQVRNFMQWTQSNEKTAIHCLSSQNWNLELACDAYYQNPQLYMCMTDVVDQRSLHAFFLKYANSISFNYSFFLVWSFVFIKMQAFDTIRLWNRTINLGV